MRRVSMVTSTTLNETGERSPRISVQRFAAVGGDGSAPKRMTAQAIAATTARTPASFAARPPRRPDRPPPCPAPALTGRSRRTLARGASALVFHLVLAALLRIRPELLAIGPNLTRSLESALSLWRLLVAVEVFELVAGRLDRGV
jgi:hypothetical protein